MTIQHKYLKDIATRNTIEVEQCLSFIKDYIHLQRELTQSKRDYSKSKQEKGLTGGDQSELRAAREELDRLRAHLGNQELGHISKQLDTTEQAAKESDKIRDIQRKNLAM